MSYKTTAFNLAVPHIQTLDKFIVYIPGNAMSVMLVKAASLPFINRVDSPITMYGRTVNLPSNIVTSGTWDCVLEENFIFTGHEVIEDLMKSCNHDAIFINDIYIYMLDSLSGSIPVKGRVLKYTYLKSVKPVNLDWSSSDKSLTYDLTFAYNDIEYVSI